MLSRPIVRELLTQLHRGSQWGPQAMCDAVLRVYGCVGIFAIVKQVNESCITCKRVNKQALRKQPSGETYPGLRLFQSIQVDYTEMPKIGCLKYLLVTVDHVTNWVEAILLPSATASNVTKLLSEAIVPQFGLVENIKSDNGSHFTATIVGELMKSLGISHTLAPSFLG